MPLREHRIWHRDQHFTYSLAPDFKRKIAECLLFGRTKKKQIHKNTHLNHTKWRLFLIDKNTATHTLILWFGIRKLGQSIINTGFFRFCVFSSYFALCVCALIDLQLLARVMLSLVSCHVCEFISYGFDLIWFNLPDLLMDAMPLRHHDLKIGVEVAAAVDVSWSVYWCPKPSI